MIPKSNQKNIGHRCGSVKRNGEKRTPKNKPASRLFEEMFI
jgi:hypothetical protein